MITRLEASGYRLLNDFEADFGDLTVVIGANATGKSTVLDCLELISLSAMLPLQDAMNPRGGIGSVLSALPGAQEIAWKVTFRKPQRNPYWQGMPLPPDRDFVYEARIRAGRSGEATPVYEALRSAEAPPGHPEPFKLLEASPSGCLVYDQAAKRLVPFDQEPKEGPLLQATQGNSGVLKIPPPPPPLHMTQEQRSLQLAKMRFLNEYPVPSWVRGYLGSFAIYPGFDVRRDSPIRRQAAEIRPESTLYPKGENLGTVLHEMLTRADFRSSADDLRGFLRSAYPFVDDIFAETTYGAPPRVLVRIREQHLNRSMELWDLSDGLLRFLCLAAALLNPIPPGLIGIDEPEVGLHPRLLPIVADMIKTAAETTQVLVTTHSPDLLNCFGLDNVGVMTRDEEKVQWRRPGGREALRKLLESVAGETLGDLHRSGELEAV